MAFLAKQFMSLFLLLIISRLILSTHATRQYFSQSVRAATTAATTATATNPTNEKTDELSQDETQPGFYPNKGQQHGLGTPLPRPPYLPWNYNTVKYTTKPSPPNTFQQENEETVAEKYGKYSEQYIEDTKKANQFYFKDNNYGTRNNEKYNNNKVEEEDEEEEEEPLATKEESNNNYNNNYNNNKLTNSNSNSKFDEDNQQQYSNTHFYNSKSKRNQEYQPQYKNEWAQTTNTAPVKKQTTFTRTTPEKGTSFYANTDEELDKLLEAEEDDDSSNSNSNSKLDSAYRSQYTTYTPPYYKKQTTFTQTTTPEKRSRVYANTDDELNKLLEAEDDDDNSNSNSNSKLDSAYRSQYTTNSPPYYKKQNTFTQTTTPEKRTRVYANTDDELNELLEAEDEKPETRSKEQLYGKPQGMSDTRWKENSRFYDVENEKFVDKQSWTEQSLDKYGNAFSGNALAYANQNNNP